MGIAGSRKIGVQANNSIKIISCISQDVLDAIEREIGSHHEEVVERLTDEMIKESLERNSTFPNLNQLYESLEVFESLEFSEMEGIENVGVLELFGDVERIIEAYDFSDLSKEIVIYMILKAIFRQLLHFNQVQCRQQERHFMTA